MRYYRSNCNHKEESLETLSAPTSRRRARGYFSTGPFMRLVVSQGTPSRYLCYVNLKCFLRQYRLVLVPGTTSVQTTCCACRYGGSISEALLEQGHAIGSVHSCSVAPTLQNLVLPSATPALRQGKDSSLCYGWLRPLLRLLRVF